VLVTGCSTPDDAEVSATTRRCVSAREREREREREMTAIVP